MSKDVATLYKTIGESFLALSEIFNNEESPRVTTTDKASVDTTSDETVKAEAKTYTKEEVRAALSIKAKLENGKYKPEVKALVAKYSNDVTFPNVPEDKYPELMMELEVVGNA